MVMSQSSGSGQNYTPRNRKLLFDCDVTRYILYIYRLHYALCAYVGFCCYWLLEGPIARSPEAEALSI